MKMDDDLFCSLLRLAFRDLPIPIRAKTASTFLAVTLDNTFAPLVLVPDAGVYCREDEDCQFGSNAGPSGIACGKRKSA